MERYADGDDSAFGDLYAALAPRLMQFLGRRAADPATAADLLQQTMLQLHLTRGRFLRGANVVPWAFAIAQRVAIDEARRNRRSITPLTFAPYGVEDEPVAGLAAADDELHARRLARRAGAEVARLPEPQRAAFHLMRSEGLSVREVAQRLGTSANAVKLRVHRAYVALRAALRDETDGKGQDD
jgi:RNA polymerase sigma-70 factor (ECF subfamily)